jgi:STE24 endopeptidase
MPFLLLLFLTLACLPDEWSPPFTGLDSPLLIALLTWGGVVLVLGSAAFLNRKIGVLVRDGRRELAQRRYSSWRFYHQLGLLGAYSLSLYVFGWGWAVQQFLTAGKLLPPGAEFLILAPFLVPFILGWAIFFSADRALHAPAVSDPSGPYGSRWTYVGVHLRQNLAFVFIPLLLVIVNKGIHAAVPDPTNEWQTELNFVQIGLLLLLFLCMPLLLRFVLGLEPLPAGPLRDRLEATARRLRFRCTNLLLWNTRRGVANAMVAGVLPWLRYVVFTDGLLIDLTPEEVDAVFGHEIGHVKHHHMLYYIGFLLISVFSLTLVGAEMLQHYPVVKQWLNDYTPQYLAVVPAVGVLGAYIFLVFGFLSRRCERQADIFGCRAVSCANPACPGEHEQGAALALRGRGLCPAGIRTFVDALEKVAALNGIPRERPGWLHSWQHSTIARRVDFLQRMRSDPTLEPRFQRTVRVVKWGVLLGLGACLAFFYWRSGMHV